MAPQEIYNKNIEVYSKEVSRLKKQLVVLSMLRLSVFLLMGAFVYFFWGNLSLIVSSLTIGFILFFVLVSRYADIKSKERYTTKLKEINTNEIHILNGDLSELSTGSEFIYEEHDYNQDIDLFGEGSLFQLINRTSLPKGKEQLASWLNSNDISRIEQKQKAAKDIQSKIEWRQHFTATGSLIESDLDSNTILNWVNNYKAFVPHIFKWLPIVFSIVSVAGIVLYSLNLISGYFVGGWFFLGIGLSGRYVKKAGELFNTTSKINDILAQYAKLLKAIENEGFDSVILKEWQANIRTNGVKASDRLEELSKEIGLLANRNNLIFAPVANGFLLWDLRFSYRIEQWLRDFDGAMKKWFETIEQFDAVNSFGNFCFNHPDYIYPSLISEKESQLESTSLGHPLLNSETMVTNSVDINTEDFFIITGANMAGKSTFLRTVAINVVMANCGLPVCAKSFSYKPIKLISSMRTSDSLMNDESYFFSELKRLKFIVDAIKTDTYFIILDEILKGTNSKDKAEGSKKFVEKLVASNSTGLIATHDLSLCTLEEKLPQIRNHYFDAEIINDELHFDYTFKKGVCQNMNASFLLKKMEIV
jgi:hypothetical protein